jgi:rare lipoprotein A
MFKLTCLMWIFINSHTFQKQASYYDDTFNIITASGETYDENDFTAASPFLPFNTKLLVVNEDNKKYVVVKVNDRGPYKIDKRGRKRARPRRHIALSKKAFLALSNDTTKVLNIKYYKL